VQAAPGAVTRLPDWQDVAIPDHSVEIYDDSAAMLDGLAGFMSGVLRAGSPTLVIATPEHRVGLAERIAMLDGDALLDAQRDERYLVLDAEETLSRFMVDGHPERSRFVTTIGGMVARAAETTPQGSHVAAFGEMVALLWAQGNERGALELEALWNELAQSHAIYLHCAYPATLFAGAGDAAALNSICGHHSKVVGRALQTPMSPGYVCPYCWAYSPSVSEWMQHAVLAHPQRSLRVAQPLPYAADLPSASDG
jgi:hypothetical protein